MGKNDKDTKRNHMPRKNKIKKENSKRRICMQQHPKEIGLLKEYYGRHKTVIDALAQKDEMFRAVKEISEIESESKINFQL